MYYDVPDGLPWVASQGGARILQQALADTFGLQRRLLGEYGVPISELPDCDQILLQLPQRVPRTKVYRYSECCALAKRSTLKGEAKDIAWGKLYATKDDFVKKRYRNDGSIDVDPAGEPAGVSTGEPADEPAGKPQEPSPEEVRYETKRVILGEARQPGAQSAGALQRKRCSRPGAFRKTVTPILGNRRLAFSK